MTIAEKLTKEVIEKIDSFIQTDLMPWQEKASKLQFNLFREFEK
jgi:hypothetical protein